MRAVALLCAVAAGLAVGEAVSDDKAIYGWRDDRIEVIDAGAPMRRAANAVAALFHREHLTKLDGTRWGLPTDPAGPDRSWCPDERFAGQPGGATCTAFLIAPNRMATSAHCIRADGGDRFTAGIACADARFVFDYRVDATGKVGTSPDASRVYRCEAVLAGESSATGADWRVVRLDRPAHGRGTLAVYDGPLLPVGTKLSTIGYPNGLPAKLAGGATLREHRGEGFFVTDLDTYRGNSGSPVLANIGPELAVVGLLARGAEDFETVMDEGACERSRRCTVESCGGEHATMGSRLSEWIGTRVGR